MYPILLNILIAVNCGYPGNIENGEVFTPNGTEFKANITYVCHSGYELEGGNETRECLENVHWSGNTPMCTSQSNVIYYEIC